MVDEHSMFRAHWVVYHQMLRDIAKKQMEVGQMLQNQGDLHVQYSNICAVLLDKIETLEKRVAELEAKQS